ncbi:homeobox protein MSX-1 [Anolis carolinensis]|uniref:homeobox protein MSX-1 n=1 Tax=Anolis carolinensis TaxID=28377 RepID=UPI002F2B75C2
MELHVSTAVSRNQGPLRKMTNMDSPAEVLPARSFSNNEAASQMKVLDHLEPRDLPTASPRRMADFSIRSILAVDGSEGEKGDCKEPSGDPKEIQGCSWINCTRCKPPGAPKVKQAGSPWPVSRSPRVPFSAAQLGVLENSFQQAYYLSTGQVRELALLLGLTENRVKIWFQNRRARERRAFLKQYPSGRIGTKGNLLKGQYHLGWH